MSVQWPQMCAIYFQRNVITISHWNWSLKVKFEEKDEKYYWLPYHPDDKDDGEEVEVEEDKDDNKEDNEDEDDDINPI